MTQTRNTNELIERTIRELAERGVTMTREGAINLLFWNGQITAREAERAHGR